MRESASSYSSFLSFLSQFTFMLNILNRVLLHCVQKYHKHDNKIKQPRAIECVGYNTCLRGQCWYRQNVISSQI